MGISIPYYINVGILVIALVVQELSHVVFKEPTYMSNYREFKVQKWSVHTALLVPLLLKCSW